MGYEEEIRRLEAEYRQYQQAMCDCYELAMQTDASRKRIFLDSAADFAYRSQIVAERRNEFIKKEMAEKELYKQPLSLTDYIQKAESN